MVCKCIYVLFFGLAILGDIQANEYQEVTVSLPGDVFGELSSVRIRSRFWGPESAVDRDVIDGVTASDYGCHLMQIPGEGYRLYSGGTWKDSSQSPALDGLHVLLHKALNPLDGNGIWTMPDNRPEFLLGSEEGHTGTWYSGQAGFPSVIQVDGLWYMFTQVQVPTGTPLDRENTSATQYYAEMDVNRFMLFTSWDGHNWTRYDIRGVIKKIDNQSTTTFYNPEVIYVPWDPYGDGKNWWLYVSASVNGGAIKTYRIRASDPIQFGWNGKVAITMPGGLGGQISYIENAPEEPLFIRITYIEGTRSGTEGRLVPSLCFSRDGRYWYKGTSPKGCELAGSLDPSHKDCLYPALATIYGRGQLPSSEDGDYHTIYAVTTATGPSTTDLAGNSEIGYGDIQIELETPDYSTWYVKQDGTGDGKTWDTAFGSINAAIEAASDEDEIWVASGTYMTSLDISKRISLLGGFSGTEIYNTESNWGKYPTTILPLSPITGPSTVISIHTDGTHLDGLGIWRGVEDQEMTAIHYDSVTSATLTRCTIVGDFSNAISAASSSIILEDVYLAGLQGTGLRLDSSSASLAMGHIFGNVGAGIVCNSSTLDLNTCEVHTNQAETGAALFIQNSISTWINCTLAANTATTGAAITSVSSVLELTNCILWNNGDELVIEGSPPVLNYCDIEGGYPGNGNINADPVFTDSASNNFHIQGLSPCIGKGIGPSLDSRVMNHDIDRNVRSGDACDIGFDEYDGPTRIEDWNLY